MHGIVVWGIATFLAGILAAVSLPLLFRTPVAAATANATTSVPGESLIAYELDHLFRGSERRTGADLSYDRAEAARILLTTSSHSGMDPVDRGYLAKLVAADTGTAAPDAERRLDEVAARAKQDIVRARSSAVILAFMAGTAALLGAIAAWAAAVTAGRYRERTRSRSRTLGLGPRILFDLLEDYRKRASRRENIARSPGPQARHRQGKVQLPSINKRGVRLVYLVLRGRNISPRRAICLVTGPFRSRGRQACRSPRPL